MRDYQQQKVYDAEAEALKGIEEEEMTFDALVEYWWEVYNSRFVCELMLTNDHVSPVFDDFELLPGDKRTRHARANDKGAIIPEGMRLKSTVLHEMAHTLTINDEEEFNAIKQQAFAMSLAPPAA